MFWSVIGWIVAALLLVSVLYSLRFHLRNYSRMKCRAGNQIADALSSRHLTNALIMQTLKVVLIAALVYWLTVGNQPDSRQEEAQSDEMLDQ